MIDPPIIKRRLQERESKGNKRKLRDQTHLQDFSSNDYLGLARNEDLRQFQKKYLSRYGRLTLGGTGSRLLSGNTNVYEEVEEFLSKYFKAESALIFNSGYMANQGLISAVATRGDTVIYDQLSHICIKEGAWLSRATSYSFLHNDLMDLESRLRSAKGTKFVITESVFSMDGDFSPLEELVSLCQKHGAYLIVDEAHSTGVYGEGAGLLVEKNLQDKVFACIYTFGKGPGFHGACVTGTKALKEYLINFCRTFIYTTSFPPTDILKIRSIFEFISENPGLHDQLMDRIRLFKKDMGNRSISDSAIQPVIIPGNEKCRNVADRLQELGFDVRAILSPTVKKGEERLRVSLHVHNSQEDVKRLAGEIISVI